MQFQFNSPEFMRLLNAFLEEIKKEGKSHSFSQIHKTVLSEFFSFSEINGIREIKKVDQAIVDRYFSYLKNERINSTRGGMLASSTLGNHSRVLSNFFKYLFSEKIFVPFIKIKPLKRKTEKDIISLSQKEIEWLYSVTDGSAIGKRDRCMLALYYGCGLRKSEGLRLQVTDFDFNRGWIRIRQTKTNRERFVMMSPKVQSMVEDYVYSGRDIYLADNSPYEELFIGERGGPIHSETLASRIEFLWEKVQNRYGSKKWIGCHTLRHSLGTHLYIAGMKIEMIALMLGHRCLESTQIYIHLSKSIKANT